MKPAYRALFRKTVTRRLEGQDVPQRLEIQLINGARAGLWVDAQSSSIEFHGRPAIMTVARDVSHRKSIEVSLSRSKRQAQYTLESIGEGIITTDNDGHIDYMNLAAATMPRDTRSASCSYSLTIWTGVRWETRSSGASRCDAASTWGGGRSW